MPNYDPKVKSFCAGCGRITKDRELYWDYERQGQARGYCRKCAGKRSMLTPWEMASMATQQKYIK